MSTHVVQDLGAEGIRKRRSHKKSRGGCRNCKLRRVKCDETKPKCKNCMALGVSCSNSKLDAPDLQTEFGQIAAIKAPLKPIWPVDQPLPGITGIPACLYPVISDNISTFQLDAQSMDRLSRFQARTVLAIGSERNSQVLHNTALEFAFSNPYLMHVVQTLTAMHDRYLSVTPTSRQAITDVCYHWTQAVTLFNRKLSSPIQPADRDPLWTTAAFLGVIALASVDGSTPEDVWPLKRAEVSDLDWLRMSDGKKAVWNITNPLRPDSIYHSLADEYEGKYLVSPGGKPGVDGIPPAFVKLYGLDESSSAENSPYHTAVRAITTLLPIECNRSNMPHFLSFISHVPPVFRRYLEMKDPRALLLLAYWYAKVCRSLWYMERRATLECQATCIYLERYYPHQTAIQELLQFPKDRCGLVSSMVQHGAL